MNIIKKQTLNNTYGIGGCIMFFASAICILSSASATSKGAFEGLKICSNIIIPSLFPFTVLSILFQKSGGLLWLGKFFDKTTFMIFGLSGIEFSVLLLSLVGGYPVGAKIINELYKSGEISKSKGEALLKFCINPSPAFFISALGVNILKNKIAGYILLIANTVACFILNMILMKSKKADSSQTKQIVLTKENFSDSFVQSVFEGAKIILNICAFVTLFSSITEILKPVFTNPKIYSLFCPILEISFGINKIKNSGLPIHFYSFFLAFGGISTICQIKQVANVLKPSFLKLAFYRTLHGGLASIISFALFKIFPQSALVFSNGTEIIFSGYTLFYPSIMLIVFSVLFLMFLSPNNKRIDFNKN